jgi:hypothetical protein
MHKCTLTPELSVNPGSNNMAMSALLEASGLWASPMRREALTTVRAFYDRPWHGHCSIEDVITLAAEKNVDPLPLMKMLVAIDELKVDFDLD